MEKYQCFATNIFWSQKCDFFGDFGQKTRTAGLIMLKLSTKVNQVFWEKNLENENFMAAAIHCENWYFKKTNIFHYFPSKNLKYSQIFLSETIHAQENGSRGPHFAKSLNSNFLKGLTYSAMAVCNRHKCWWLLRFLLLLLIGAITWVWPGLGVMKVLKVMSFLTTKWTSEIIWCY